MVAQISKYVIDTCEKLMTLVNKFNNDTKKKRDYKHKVSKIYLTKYNKITTTVSKTGIIDHYQT